ncbi:glycosyltransferase [Psychromonas sp. MME2]|uniref:glycosyltransferase n=1 Tax=unclassified Psychromonas TaxID=2614957 RepID=UPI00339CEBDF
MTNTNNSSSLGQHIYRWMIRVVLTIYYCLLTLFKIMPQKKVPKKVKILVTGTFYSDHWLITHLKPMANASNCAQLTMVAATEVPEINNVQGAYAPEWLQKITGKVGARLLYFSWIAIKERPDVLVGFHILINGLFVALLARLIGAKSIYICGGGPREVQGGGIKTENRIFNRIGQADLFIENLLLKSINTMSLIVTMGASAINYFQEKGITAPCEIVPGGFDDTIFCPDENVSKIYDLILIGRLSEIKRVDRFLLAIKKAQQILPNLNAVIVGDGPDKEALQYLAERLEIAENIHFAGWQNNVHEWLQKSKCFSLTSDSEGLSQALIQAMMVGVPAITSDVGDLGDLLKEGKNGYLVSPLTEDAFASAYIKFFEAQSSQFDFSKQAYQDTREFSFAQVELHWHKIFSELQIKNGLQRD